MQPSVSKYSIENRDFNIITCQNINRATSQQSLPPLKKLGYTNDYPFPRKAKFEIQNEQYNQTQQLAIDSAGSQNKPASLMNASSVKFNFISLTKTNQQNLDEMKEGLKIINKKKGGMGENADLGGLCYPNFNKDYQEKFKENQMVFRKTKGMYPAVQEVKYTYGPFMKPFKKYKF